MTTIPLQITFHKVPHHDGIEGAIRSHLEWLGHYYGKILSCRVVVDQPHSHHRNGNPYEVRIDLKVPGRELVVRQGTDHELGARDLDVVVREAFEEARRQLEDFAHRQRLDVKAHEPQPRARVARVLPFAGYGFLETPDGREIYFHRNSVVRGDFKDLAVGTEVCFVEEQGDKGPQASTVKPVGHHNHH